MKGLLFFDTETTDLPQFKEPSDGPKQPHIVQLAALLVDADTRKIVQSMNVIVRPDGWEIPQEMTDIHGISTEFAAQVGLSESLVLSIFLSLWRGRTRVAYNTTFDNRIIRIATKRYSSNETVDMWKAGDYECSMQMARQLIKARTGISKAHKLIDAHQAILGSAFSNQHSAMADTLASMRIYFAIKDAEQL